MALYANGSAGDLTSLWEAVFQNVPDAVFVTDKDGYALAANPAMERITGYRLDELVGKVHICDICLGVGTSLSEKSCANCFMRQTQLPSFEMRIQTKEGGRISVAASSSRLPEIAEGALAVIMRDMSEQNRIERERLQRGISTQVMEAQEEERKRVSRDLHDGVGQALYSVLIGLKMVRQQGVGKDVRRYLEDAEQTTTQVLEEVKSLSVELRPSALDDLGLIPAIRSYIKKFEQTFGIETCLEVRGQKRRYNSAMETAIYRICQEAMINAAKYADTDRLMVRLLDEEDYFVAEIQDFGQGFDFNEAHVEGTGLGLYGMKERANLLGGDIQIHSSKGHGTLIRVSIPIGKKDN